MSRKLHRAQWGVVAKFSRGSGCPGDAPGRKAHSHREPRSNTSAALRHLLPRSGIRFEHEGDRNCRNQSSRKPHLHHLNVTATRSCDVFPKNVADSDQATVMPLAYRASRLSSYSRRRPELELRSRDFYDVTATFALDPLRAPCPLVGATLLGGYRFDLRRKPAENQFLQANLLPRIVDVDTHEIAQVAPC